MNNNLTYEVVKKEVQKKIINYLYQNNDITICEYETLISKCNEKINKIKDQIDKDDKTKSSFFMLEEHNILILELVYKGFLDENDTQIFIYDNLFEELLEDGNSYKDLVQIIHYLIPRVVNRKFRDEEGNYNKKGNN